MEYRQSLLLAIRVMLFLGVSALLLIAYAELGSHINVDFSHYSGHGPF